jgi:LPXTG-motif cell wall-anchored protein
MTPWDWTLAVFGLALVVSIGIVGYRLIRGEKTGVSNTWIFLVAAIVFLGLISLYFSNKWDWLEALNNWHPF